MLPYLTSHLTNLPTISASIRVHEVVLLLSLGEEGDWLLGGSGCLP